MVSQTPEAGFQVTFAGEMPQVLLPSRLSILEAVAFKSTCQQLFSGSNVPAKIILNFSQTTFIDSSGIGALVSNLKSAKQRGCELVLRDVHPQVMAVFALTSLDQVLTIEQPVQASTHTEAQRGDNHLPVTHPSVQSWVKRLIDIVGALVGLMITGILFIPIVIAIKIDSPAPCSSGKPGAVGWVGGFGCGNFAPCASTPKPSKPKFKIKPPVPSLRMTTTPELRESGASCGGRAWTNCLSFGTSSKAK